MGAGDPRLVHVVHVAPGLGPGGMELAMVRVVNALTQAGMRHTIVCLKGDPILRDRLDPAVEIHCLRAGSHEPLLPWRLRKLISSTRPTVIHARNWSAWPDVALARMTILPAVPLIFSFHGRDRSGPMPLRRRLAFWLLGRATPCLLTVSAASKEFLVRHVRWPADRVRVIPNGVDTAVFKQRTAGRDRPRAIVGSVGGLRGVKNYPLLIRACADLLKNRLDLELRIAGDGPEMGRLVELSKSLGVADRVRLLGHVPDVPAFLADLDVFCLPSDSEQNPNALLEAMATGLPCVATRVGAVPELFDSGRCGLIVQPGNRRALAEAIRKLLSKKQLRRDLGASSRRRVCQRYNLERMVAGYADLYTRLSTRRPARQDTLDAAFQSARGSGNWPAR